LYWNRRKEKTKNKRREQRAEKSKTKNVKKQEPDARSPVPRTRFLQGNGFLLLLFREEPENLDDPEMVYTFSQSG
jgi:hypothetical protein